MSQHSRNLRRSQAATLDECHSRALRRRSAVLMIPHYLLHVKRCYLRIDHPSKLSTNGVTEQV